MPGQGTKEGAMASRGVEEDGADGRGGWVGMGFSLDLILFSGAQGRSLRSGRNGANGRDGLFGWFSGGLV